MVTPPALGRLTGIGEALHRVETALRASVTSDDPFLTEVASHLITAGGKRVRPALAITAAAIGRDGSVADIEADVIQGAISVELVHLGSLYHDDVMDEAETRRNVASVNARWGNLVAILAGDFLLARASEIASALGTEVAGLLAATISRLCEGQVAELQHAYDVARSEDAYFSSIAGKTAALMATSCRIGAIVGGLPRDQVESLTDFGHKFGMVFQIVDDVLDVVATDEELGKPAGNDIAEGVYTLPVIRALASGTSGDLSSRLGHPLERTGAVAARDIVRANGAVTSSVAEARSYADLAVKALDGLPPGDAVDGLAALAHELVDRVAR